MADDQNPELPLTPPPGGDGPGALNIQPVNIEEEMKRSYLDYSMSVIIGRALPDVRDGLKPVHRRILYTLQQMGLQPNKATRKCARIVGEVMGKYHPHGNLAVYDALVRLAQTWSMRYPLILVRATSAQLTEIRPPPIVTPRPSWRRFPQRSSKTSTKRPSISMTTTTAAKSSLTFFPRAFRISSSMAPTELPSAWPQKFLRITSRRSSTPPSRWSTIPTRSSPRF